MQIAVNSLFSHGTLLDATPRRWKTTMAASAILHVVFVATVVYVGWAAGLVLPPREARPLTFIRLVPPDPPRLIPPAPARLPPVAKEEPKIAEAAPVKIEAPPIPERVTRRVEPTPAPAPPTPRERPRPAPPTVTVGTFALNANSPRASEVSRSVQPAEFDAPAARAPEIRTVSAAVGAFEQSAVRGRPQPGTDRPIADAGFGTGLAAGPARPGGRVADSGFGSGVAAAATVRSGAEVVAAGGFDAGKSDAARTAQPTQAVKTSDFDARAAQPAAPQPPRQPRMEVALEVLSKPTPVYTDEARALKIEGEVLLEVEFTATGEIRVLKIVRGLGHGLDESAARAVQGMRFKPAQRNGQPIDVRTTVNIVFRLA